MTTRSSQRRGLTFSTRCLLFTLGISIASWGFCAFLLSNSIVTGGLPGLSLILFQYLGWNPAIIQWFACLPIFVLGYIILGKSSTLSSLAGALLLPAAILLFTQLPETHVNCENSMVAALAGGFVVGVGLGLVFSANASVGGFSQLAQILSKYTPLSLTKSLMLLDAMVLLISASLFGPEAAIMGIISIVALSKGIDVVLTGFGKVKSVTIITDKAEELKTTLFERIDCGATLIEAKGGFSANDKNILLCVIPVSKLARLKRNVAATDPDAFTVISDATEVMGYGF